MPAPMASRTTWAWNVLTFFSGSPRRRTPCSKFSLGTIPGSLRRSHFQQGDQCRVRRPYSPDIVYQSIHKVLAGIVFCRPWAYVPSLGVEHIHRRGRPRRGILPFICVDRSCEQLALCASSSLPPLWVRRRSAYSGRLCLFFLGSAGSSAWLLGRPQPSTPGWRLQFPRGAPAFTSPSLMNFLYDG